MTRFGGEWWFIGYSAQSGFRVKPGMTHKDIGRESRTYVIPDVSEPAR